MHKSVSILILSAALIGCGGGSGSGSGSSGPAPMPEGLFTGLNSDNRSVWAEVLSDGSVWMIYSGMGTPAVVGGVIQGSWTTSGNNFLMPQGNDYNTEGNGINPVTVGVGTFNEKKTLYPTVVYSPNQSLIPVVFTLNYNSSYELTPAWIDIVGTYNVSIGAVNASTSQTDDADTGTVTITAPASGSTAGQLAGTTQGGCAFGGPIMPRADANVYDVDITFNGAPCVNNTDTLSGIAFLDDSTTPTLYGASLTSDQSESLVFFGPVAQP